jgi:hydroxymethylpyrimidine pyrophosphatase-like HAD family hydrolase
MLDVAGHAVLLENAPEDLKEIAKGRRWQIGPNHNHDGVAWVLESFFPPPA